MKTVQKMNREWKLKVKEWTKSGKQKKEEPREESVKKSTWESEKSNKRRGVPTLSGIHRYYSSRRYEYSLKCKALSHLRIHTHTHNRKHTEQWYANTNNAQMHTKKNVYATGKHCFKHMQINRASPYANPAWYTALHCNNTHTNMQRKYTKQRKCKKDKRQKEEQSWIWYQTETKQPLTVTMGILWFTV